MRIVTWNCHKGPYAAKIAMLESLHADIAVVPECPRPIVASPHCLWFGDNPLQGIAVFASARFVIKAVPPLEGVPKFVIPVAVSGAAEFILLAVWSKNDTQYPYIEGVVKAVEMYRGMIDGTCTVLMGDLNSNAIWDKTHPAALNHSALVSTLESVGMSSAYHSCHGEEHGMETRYTYYHYRQVKRPFHIDYCFIPTAWCRLISQVEVGGYSEWKDFSDHRPLIVDIDLQDQIGHPKVGGEPH